MTNEEKINRLRNIQRCTPIHDREDCRDLGALEAAIVAIETLDKIESESIKVFNELAEKRLANYRLIVVSGMSTEELTDAFTKGYRLVSPEAAQYDIPDDLRIVPKNGGEG